MSLPNPSADDAEQPLHAGASDEPLAVDSSSAFLDPVLNEDAALALLKRHDVSAEALEQLAKSTGVMKSRKVKLAVVQHPQTPRRVSLPLLRQLFTFELMQITLNPVTLADIKKNAEEVLINKLESISLGEKLTLARRASGNVAGALLRDPEPRIMRVALENTRLTEASVVKAILREGAPAAMVQAVCHHAKWLLRREVRIALLRNANTPLAQALKFAQALPPRLVAEILQSSNLPANVKSVILKEVH